MKLQKNKIVFASIVAFILLFLGGYGYILMTDETEPESSLTQPEIPQWKDAESEFTTKIEAIDALKEERETIVPSVYPDHMIDEKGYFNPDYMEYEKQRIIDSVQGEQTYSENYQFDFEKEADRYNIQKITKDPIDTDLEEAITLKELVLQHQLFFASKPKQNFTVDGHLQIPVQVDGDQIVSDGHRLEMRLLEDVQLGGEGVKRNTPIYGFVKIRPNRVLIDIVHINNKEVQLKAHDFQDGSEGIYVENSLKGDIRDQVANDAIGEINVPGFPQVNGVKRLFQRNNRRVKVEIVDNYQLILKHKNR